MQRQKKYWAWKNKRAVETLTMAKFSIKNIIEKEEITSVLSSLGAQGISFCIRDNKEKILFGEALPEKKATFRIAVDGEQIATVEGDEKAVVAYNLLQYLVQKETEKKKLGAEVLNLYKEINLIFNFSI